MANMSLGNIVVNLMFNSTGFNAGIAAAKTRLTAFNTSVNAVGAGLNRTLTRAFQGATIAAAGFTAAITVVGSRFEKVMDEVQAVSGATALEMQALETEARRIGASTAFTATQAGQAMIELSRAGLSAAETLRATADVVNFAGANNFNLAQSAELVAATMRQFGMASSETTRIVDVFTRVSQKSLFSAETLRESFKFAGTAANAMGFEIEEAAAAVAQFRNLGLEGSLAGTNFRMAMLSMAAPTQKARKAIEELGLSARDINPQVQGFEQAFRNLGDAFRRLGDETLEAQYANDIFSARVATNALVLSRNISKQTNDTRGGFAELRQFMEDSAGTAERTYDTMMGNVTSRVEIFRSALSELFLEIFEEMQRPLARLFDGLSERVVRIATQFNAMGDSAEDAFDTLVDGILAFVDGIIEATPYIKLIGEALFNAFIVIQGVNLIRHIGLLVASVRTFGLALVAFGGPAGAAILALGALATAFMTLSGAIREANKEADRARGINAGADRAAEERAARIGDLNRMLEAQRQEVLATLNAVEHGEETLEAAEKRRLERLVALTGEQADALIKSGELMKIGDRLVFTEDALTKSRFEAIGAMRLQAGAQEAAALRAREQMKTLQEFRRLLDEGPDRLRLDATFPTDDPALKKLIAEDIPALSKELGFAIDSEFALAAATQVVRERFQEAEQAALTMRSGFASARLGAAEVTVGVGEATGAVGELTGEATTLNSTLATMLQPFLSRIDEVAMGLREMTEEEAKFVRETLGDRVEFLDELISGEREITAAQTRQIQHALEWYQLQRQIREEGLETGKEHVEEIGRLANAIGGEISRSFQDVEGRVRSLNPAFQRLAAGVQRTFETIGRVIGNMIEGWGRSMLSSFQQVVQQSVGQLLNPLDLAIGAAQNRVQQQRTAEELQEQAREVLLEGERRAGEAANPERAAQIRADAEDRAAELRLEAAEALNDARPESFIQDTLDDIDEFVNAFVDAVPRIVKALVDEIPQIVGGFIEAIPALVNGLLENIDDLIQVVMLLVAEFIGQIPTIISEVLVQVPAIAQAIVDELPTIINALIAEMPRIISGLIDQLPVLLNALVQLLPQLTTMMIIELPKIAVALVSALIAELPALLVALAVELPIAIAESLVQMGKDIAQGFIDFVTLGIPELFRRRQEGETRSGLAGFLDRMVDGFREAGDAIAGLFGGRGNDEVRAHSGMDYVSRTMRTVLEPGEAVINAMDNARRLAGRSFGTEFSPPGPGYGTGSQGGGLMEVLVQLDSRVVDAQLYDAGRLGNTPRMSRAIRRESGVKTGFRRGKINVWGN